jgi:protein-S-isoprenylcysteine O-methyltransferase Ste14
MTPDDAIYIPWSIWAVTWIAAAWWADDTVARPAFRREGLYRLVNILGFVSLLGGYAVSGRDGVRMHMLVSSARLWQPPAAAGWVMVVLAALGFAFAWWARIHLGRLWSAAVTRKTGHRVIDTGPYAIVRHPIYTALLTAAIATLAIKGTIAAAAGCLLLVVGYVLKARVEERFLSEQLGRSAYDAYRRRVPMLVPFAPMRG